MVHRLSPEDLACLPPVLQNHFRRDRLVEDNPTIHKVVMQDILAEDRPAVDGHCLGLPEGTGHMEHGHPAADRQAEDRQVEDRLGEDLLEEGSQEEEDGLVVDLLVDLLLDLRVDLLDLQVEDRQVDRQAVHQVAHQVARQALVAGDGRVVQTRTVLIYH